MFLACGYDTLDVIADLNICESETNDIDRILDFVNTTFPQDKRLVAIANYLATYVCLQLSSKFNKLAGSIVVNALVEQFTCHLVIEL